MLRLPGMPSNTSNMNRDTHLAYQKRYENLLNHVVLPRCLPQNKSKDFHNEELALLSYMIDNVESLAQSIPSNTVNMFRGLGRVHKTLKASVVSAEINNLKAGSTFAMYIRRQNCAIMIRRPPGGNGDRVIVSTFPGNLHPKYVYSAESDIEVRIE